MPSRVRGRQGVKLLRDERSISAVCPPTPAAQYLRMSTEHQEYSIENQRAAILEYAQKHQFAIVSTYCDSARSGLTARHRSGLCELLRTVLSGKAPFKSILVFDVSRWGRFQDTDEAGHYEYLCRQSGVSVHYCAEPFHNDGTMSNTILKNLKRAMAGEYSRELGVRVYEAKARVIEEGCWGGGRPPFGMRRRLVSVNARIWDLEPGERKYFRADKVLLVPGDARDVACVKKMYALALKGVDRVSIARTLTREGCLHAGKPWNSSSVTNILSHPVYAGDLVWGRTSQKLAGPTLRVPKEKWIRGQVRLPPIIDRTTFDRVQNALRQRRVRRAWPDRRILSCLRRLLTEKHRLTIKLIDSTPGMPSTSTVRAHFGSCLRAYEIIGYSPSARYVRVAKEAQRTLQLRQLVVSRLQVLFPNELTVIDGKAGARPTVRVENSGPLVSIIVCRSVRTASGKLRWQMPPLNIDGPLLLCRLDATNRAFHSFYLLPNLDLRRYRRLKEDDFGLPQSHRLADLSRFLDLARAL